MVDGVVLALIFVPIGLTSAFFGKKIFRFLLPVVAFWFGVGIVFYLTKGTDSIILFGLGTILGLFLGMLAFLFYRIGLLIFFMGIGFVLLCVISSFFNLGDNHILGLGGMLIVSLVFALIAVFSKLDDLVKILASAFFGANYILLGLMALIVGEVDMYNLHGSFEAYSFSTLTILFLIGSYLFALIGGSLFQIRRNK